MEEGLKVILSADVTQFQEAFTRAAATAKTEVNAINNTLASTSRSAEQAAKTWKEFVGERMGQYMKQFGSHGAAIRQIAAEWAVYKQAVQQAGSAGAGIGQTAGAVQQVAAALSGLKQVSLPSTAPLVQGLTQAENAIKKFSLGTGTVQELNAAILQVARSKDTLSNTTAIDTLLAKLLALRVEATKMQAVGLSIDPKVNVPGTLRDIESIKGLLGREQFQFTLTADPTPLAGSMQRAVQSTQAAVQDINQNLAGVNFTPPSTATLVQSLQQAENAVKQFASGKIGVDEVNAAIQRLTIAKTGLADTTAIDKLIIKLQALSQTGAAVKSIGLEINPNVDVSGTLRDIEKVKGLIAGQEFNFTLTADGKQLQGEMVRSVESTRTAVAQINDALKGAGTGFAQMTVQAKLSVTEYVRALSQLNNVPTAVKTTVQAPDMTPVIEAVRRVKSEITAASVAALPKLTLDADTTGFTQNLLRTKAVSQETWAAMRQTFAGVDKAIADAAARSRVSVQQLLQNFNALKGAGPNAVVTTVVPPNFAPVIQAAKIAREQVNKTWVTPLPSIPLSSSLPQMQKQFASTTAVGMQFNQLLREMPNFAIDARIGVMSLSNNLPYFVDAIQSARKQGQGFGSIIKTMGASMFSVSGIAILAVTAFTAFAGSFRKTKDQASEMRDELAKAREASENFVESLELISKTRLKGEMNAQKELVTLKLLYEASQNQNLSLADRRKAVDELQRIYPAYFKNLKDETILAGDAKKAYDELTQAILRKAKAESAQEELKQLASEERRLRAERRQAGAEALKNADELKRAQAGANANQAGAAQSQYAALAVTRDVSKEQTKYNNAVERSGTLLGKINKNLADQKRLTEEIASYGVDAIIDPTKGLKTPDPKDKKTKFEFLEEWLDFNPNAANISEEQRQKLLDVINRYSDQFGQILEGANFRSIGNNEKMIEAAKKWWEDFQNGFVRLAPRRIDVDFSQIPVEPTQDMPPAKVLMPTTLTFTPEEIRENEIQDRINNVVNDWREEFKNIDLKFPEIDTTNISPRKLNNIYRAVAGFAQTINDVFRNAFQEGFAAIGDGIAAAIDTGSIAEGLKSIISVLGEAVTQIGKALIEYGVVKSGLDKILKAGIAIPGAVAIAAGVSAVAIGQLIKASFKPFADGGIAYGPTLGLVGEYAGASANPEVIAPLSKLKDMIKGVGGGSNMHLSGNFRVAGSDLVLALDRTQRSQRRSY